MMVLQQQREASSQHRSSALQQDTLTRRLPSHLVRRTNEEQSSSFVTGDEAGIPFNVVLWCAAGETQPPGGGAETPAGSQGRGAALTQTTPLPAAEQGAPSGYATLSSIIGRCSLFWVCCVLLSCGAQKKPVRSSDLFGSLILLQRKSSSTCKRK